MSNSEDININSIYKDKCYYCDEIGTYWDQVGATIISVCKKHTTFKYEG